MRTRLAALTAAVSFSGLVLATGLTPTAALAQDATLISPAAGVPSALREATQSLLRARAGAEQAQGTALRTTSDLATARTAADRARAAAADAARRAGKASADAARADRTAKAARTTARASARKAALAERRAKVRATRTLKRQAVSARRASTAAVLTARRADTAAVTLKRSATVYAQRARTATKTAATRKAELAAAAAAAAAAAEAAAAAAAELARAEAEAEAARLAGDLTTPTSGPAATPTALPTDPALSALRPFSRGAAFWDAIPASPRLDAASASLAAAMSTSDAKHILNVTQYGQPVYTATPTTPRYRLTITNLGTGPGQWGDNHLAHADVPIPLEAKPSPGTDGKLVVIDPVARKVYDMWVAERTPTGGPGGTQGWSVAWGGVYDLDGDGSGHTATYGSGQYQVKWPLPVSRGTGSGISSAAGVLRVDELAAGRIDHALVFSTDIPCGPVDSSAYRFPATTTDGWITDRPCIPQGARLQLDPSIDLAAIPGITRAELVIGRALQTHGAYAMDKGGARMALVAETPENDAEAAVYKTSGVSWDYFGLTKLPWSSLRVLASYDGS